MTSGVFISHSPFCLLGQALLQNPELTDLASPASLGQESPPSTFQELELHLPGFYMGTENLNSGPHACTSTLSTGPFPQHHTIHLKLMLIFEFLFVQHGQTEKLLGCCGQTDLDYDLCSDL